MLPVTLYVPFYNASRTIEKVIKGILELEPKPERVILINDGSKEELPFRNDKYPIEIIRHPVNQGLARARNTALNNCLSEYIASLDSDVIPEKNWLGILFSKIDKSDKIAGSGGYLKEVNLESMADRWRAKHRMQHWGNCEILNPGFLAGANTLFKTSVLKKIGGYNEELRTNSEDVDISRRIMKEGFDLIYTPDAEALHLRKDNIISILRMDFAWSLLSYKEDGKYRSIKDLLRLNYLKTRHLMHLDYIDKDYSFLIIDIILGIYTFYKDIGVYSSNSDNSESAGYSVR